MYAPACGPGPAPPVASGTPATHLDPMPFPVRRAALACALLSPAACLPAPPKPPGEFGVHVASATSDTAHARFTVTVTGTLQLGIRSAIVAMQRDSSLLLATPADLVVSKGLGSVVITAADSGLQLAITPLDSADARTATARGHAVRMTRVGETRHVTAAAVSDTITLPEVRR